MASSTGTSIAGDDGGLFVGWASVSQRGQSENQSLDSKSVKSDGSAGSKVSNSSRRSNVPAPSISNGINHMNNSANARRFSFDTISTKAYSEIRKPYDIDTGGVRIGPPSESSYESESTDQTSHVSSKLGIGHQLNPSNIPTGLLDSRSLQKSVPQINPQSIGKNIQHCATISITSDSLTQNNSATQSKGLAGDFMGWGCGSESNYSDNNSTRGRPSAGDESHTTSNVEAVVYDDFPERPRGE